jgi:hypothetical protein
MKLSLSAAMRARDVSRPNDEHIAAAESAEAELTSGRALNSNPAQPVTPQTSETPAAPPRTRRKRQR